MTQNIHSPPGATASASHETPLAAPTVPQTQPSRQPARLSSFLQTLPTAGMFLLLGATFLYGHHTGWKFPKMSTLTGVTKPTAEPWCDEHSVPEAICVECKPELMPKPKSYGWCLDHGVNECVHHHPELAQVQGTPRKPKYDVLAALKLIPRTENNSKSSLHHARIQLASDDVAKRLGLAVDVAFERPMTESVLASGEIVFDPSRVAHLSSKVTGAALHVYRQEGETVQRGDLLALIDASQVGQAKSQLLSSIVQKSLRQANLTRLKSISTAVAGKDLIEAEASLREAEINFVTARQTLINLGYELPSDLEQRSQSELIELLRFLGVPSEIVNSLRGTTQTANLFPMIASHDGVLVHSDLVVGENVDPTKPLFTLADPKRLWLQLAVKPEDMKFLAKGQAVRFQSDDGTATASGKISWISPAIDAKTRTVSVRVPLAGDQDSMLRDKTFGTAKILLREEPNAVAVPKEAVHTVGDVQLIFVRDKDYMKDGAAKVFHVRQVRTGARDDTHVELLAGVLPREVVATKGSAALLAQLLKKNLGEGCACHAH